MDRPTDDQIHDQMDKANESCDEGISRVPGMTYEEGVAAALRWAIGDDDCEPIEDCS